MSTEYSSTNLGDISINNEVIKNISLKASTEIEGIHEISRGYPEKIWKALTKKSSARGVKLEFANESEVTITLKLMIDYGMNIPDAAGAVQENVKKAVEHMTGLTVAEVAVKIVGIQPKKNIPLKEDEDLEREV